MKIKETLGSALDVVKSKASMITISNVVSSGRKMLETASLIEQAKLKGSLGVVGAAIGVAEAVTDSVDNGWELANNFFKKNNLDSSRGEVEITILFKRGFFKNCRVNKFSSQYSGVMYSTKGESIGVLINGNSIYKAGATKGFLPEWYGDILWGDTSSATLLSVDGETSMVPTVSYSDNEYIGENCPVKFLRTHEKFSRKNINMAYLINGPPGSGKTTFCHKLSSISGKRLLSIGPNYLNDKSIPNSKLVDFISAISPEILLFEDIDRGMNSKVLLSLITDIRKRNSSILMISTVNNLSKLSSALRRPGRLGKVVHFSSPTIEWKKKVLRLYSDKIGLGRDITHLADKMNHDLFTHDYIKHVCEQAVVETDVVLEKLCEEIITNLNKG